MQVPGQTETATCGIVRLPALWTVSTMLVRSASVCVAGKLAVTWTGKLPLVAAAFWTPPAPLPLEPQPAIAMAAAIAAATLPGLGRRGRREPFELRELTGREHTSCLPRTRRSGDACGPRSVARWGEKTATALQPRRACAELHL